MINYCHVEEEIKSVKAVLEHDEIHKCTILVQTKHLDYF